jgi:hypothetical protein
MTCNLDKDISSLFEKDLENHPDSKYYVDGEDGSLMTLDHLISEISLISVDLTN